MSIVSILLAPFTLIYYLVTRLRNHLYNIGYTRSFRFDTVVISVGNLTVGGTGKSPMVEYLVRLLTPEYKVTTLSRGYGRKSRGFRMATEKDNAITLGDEPFQFFRKFSPDIKVAVGEERALAIPEILYQYPENDIILLDDAYQHRTVIPNYSILLSDFHRPFYSDYLLPSGRLRERRKGAKRADMLIITKCPSGLTDAVKQEIISKARPYLCSEIPVFFTTIEYLEPEPVWGNTSWDREVFLLTGIAKPEPLEIYVEEKYSLKGVKHFPDHHQFTVSDMEKLARQIKQQGSGNVVLTTEKDAMRLSQPEFEPIFKDLPLFYLPIKASFIKNGDIFDALIKQAAKESND